MACFLGRACEEADVAFHINLSEGPHTPYDLAPDDAVAIAREIEAVGRPEHVRNADEARAVDTLGKGRGRHAGLTGQGLRPLKVVDGQQLGFLVHHCSVPKCPHRLADIGYRITKSGELGQSPSPSRRADQTLAVGATRRWASARWGNVNAKLAGYYPHSWNSKSGRTLPVPGAVASWATGCKSRESEPLTRLSGGAGSKLDRDVSRSRRGVGTT
jgi:hypothetical protein